MTEENKKKRWQMQIANAISSWRDKKGGIYKSYEKERFTVEFCDDQIEYFKNLKP